MTEVQPISKSRVIALSSYTAPIVSENQSRKPWISFGIEGENDFFQSLIEKYQSSTTQNACIDGITNLVYGKSLKLQDRPEATDYLYKLTTKEDIKKIVMDYKMFGNAAIAVEFTEDRQSIVRFYYTPAANLRPQVCNSLGVIEGFYYSSNWTNMKPGIKPTYIPAFDSGEFTDNTQILYLKRHTPGLYYFGLPDYYSGIQYMDVEGEISQLHISNILNNFLPTSIINFNGGIPPEEQQDQIEQDIKAKFTGALNAGKFITSFNASVDEKTTVDSINNPNLHDQYKFISEEAQTKILIAHKITSKLMFGIQSPSGFSSNADELRTSLDVFNTMVISGIQNELLEPFKMLLEYNGLDPQGLIFDPLTIASIQGDLQEQVGEAAAQDIQEANQTEEEELATNEHVKNMSGKQLQGLQRIVRKYNKGELSRPQAAQLIKASFAMSDSEIELWLGVDEEQVTE